MTTKEELILDATAGNRTMWVTKNAKIIYGDVEKRLGFKPTIFMDNTKTPFPNNTFDTIFFDPPFACGKSSVFGSPNMEMLVEQYPHLAKWAETRKYTSYYGNDKFTSNNELLKYLRRAFCEFHRILKDDGLLWFKWGESKIKLKNVLKTAKGWNVLLRLPIKRYNRKSGSQKINTFWLCLQQGEQK